MKVNALSEVFTPLTDATEEALAKEIKSVFCCDLLSFVMGRAKAESAWVTVMGNVNAIAVATLADISCIVLAENVAPDEAMIVRAQSEDIALYKSEMPIFEAAKAIDALLEA
ncbi:MAG: hypothetical protein ACOX3W_03520 [Christensenellaceae bacterium]|jgi:hypothetical protein